MDMFRTPGASLEGADKKKFEETRELIDGATNDFLVRADWNANMSCVDSVNSMRSGDVLNEVMFLLRKKIASKSPQTVGLTMQLIGTLVNNCGAQFHNAMNDEKFMREMGNAIRYFSKRPGAENKDATDVALDLVQSWGEAFLPRRKQFYHIVDLYFNLRKEGLPFKVQQFDPTRVPIFAGSGASGGADNTDAILAAALQSSMALELEAEEDERRRQQQSRHPTYSDNPHRGAAYGDREYGEQRASPASQVASNTAEEVQSLQSCMSILKDLILASTHQMDFRHNEVAQEVLTQLQMYQRKMPGLIEQALMSDAQGVETLIMLNENSQSLSAIYNKIKSCEVNLVEGQRQAGAISCGETNPQPAPAHAPTVTEHRRSPAHHIAGGDADLLGMNDYSSSPRHHQQHAHHGHTPTLAAVQPAVPSHHTPRAGHHIQQPVRQEQPAYSTSHPQYPPEYPAQQYGAPQYAPQQHAQQQYAQQQYAQQQSVRIAAPLPPPPGHQRAPVLAPPPSYAQQPRAPAPAPAPVPMKTASDSNEIITVAAADPFAPDALDALFSSAPAPQVTKPAAAAVRPAAAPAHHGEVVLPQPKDHFAPEALDALFDSKPPAVSGAKADPFSDAALDALFDTPAPAAHGAHHQHTQHTTAYSHQTHQAQTTHYAQHAAVSHAQQQHYPPAPPSYGSSPRHAPQAAHQIPGQYAPQYAPQQQYAQAGSYPPAAHPPGYPQGYPQQGYPQQGYPSQAYPQGQPQQGYGQAYPQDPHQQQHAHAHHGQAPRGQPQQPQYPAQSVANPFDLLDS